MAASQKTSSVIMISKKCIVIVVSASFLIMMQALLPKTMALKKTSNINEYMVEDQRTRRQNYVVQRAIDNRDLRSMDGRRFRFDERGLRPVDDRDIKDLDIDVTYLEPKKIEKFNSAEELPALIVDYANMIRNDIILLDNSVETRTRKRGNIKVENFNQVTPDIPCSCLHREKPIHTDDLGVDFFPRYIETRKCDETICSRNFMCQKSMYNITVLRKKAYQDEKSPLTLPVNLESRWVGLTWPINIGCVCARDFIQSIGY